MIGKRHRLYRRLCGVSFVCFAVGMPEYLSADPPFSPFTQTRMAADLLKPYTEFEFQGETYALVDLVGAHNNDAASACQTNPPVFDVQSQTWRIPVTNNFVQFSGTHPTLGVVNIGSEDAGCDGYLEFINNPQNEEHLEFPVRSVFLIHVKIELPDLMGGLAFVSIGPVTITADNLISWPPPVGTEYVQAEEVTFTLEGGNEPVLTLFPDATLITGVTVFVPDQLHVNGPTPNDVVAGDTATIRASVQEGFVGVVGQEVVFTKLAGSFTFTAGDVSSNGSQTTVLTDSNGLADMTFVGDAVGSGLIEVTALGTELRAYSFFQVIAPPAPLMGDVDGDGYIDSSDTNLFIAVLLGTDTDPNHVAASDCNGDGTPDGKDIQAFVSSLVGS